MYDVNDDTPGPCGSRTPKGLKVYPSREHQHRYGSEQRPTTVAGLLVFVPLSFVRSSGTRM